MTTTSSYSEELKERLLIEFRAHIEGLTINPLSYEELLDLLESCNVEISALHSRIQADKESVLYDLREANDNLVLA